MLAYSNFEVMNGALSNALTCFSSSSLLLLSLSLSDLNMNGRHSWRIRLLTADSCFKVLMLLGSLQEEFFAVAMFRMISVKHSFGRRSMKLEAAVVDIADGLGGGAMVPEWGDQ